MLVWLILYAAGFIVTAEVCLLTLFINETSKTPVLTSAVMSVLWPLFTASYAWKYTKLFILHMLQELSELR